MGIKKEVFFRFLVGALPPFPLLITKDGKEDWKVPHIFSLGTLVVSGRGTYLDASDVCESIMQGPVGTAYRRPESLSLSLLSLFLSGRGVKLETKGKDTS